VSLGLGKRAFYLGWILLWISPVLAFLTYLGARMGRGEVLALTVGTVWLWGVDT
jgi:15-cis-phytoene synthase/lycopene beta-cyclase